MLIRKKNSLQKYSVLMSILLLTSCNHCNNKITTIDKMQADLNLSIKENKKVQAQAYAPDYVQNALLEASNKVQKKSNQKILNPQRKFNVTADNVPAQAFFLSLVEDTKQNIIVDPKVNGNISLNLKNVTINEVLDLVQRSYGFGFEEYSGGYRILPAALQSKTFYVNYLNIVRSGASETNISSFGINSQSSSDSSSSADSSSSGSSSNSSSQNSKITSNSKTDFWSELRTTLASVIGTDEGRKISISPMSGMVVIQAMPEELRKVEKVLSDMESILGRQVILEAKILEVELGDGYRAGINWSRIGTHIKASQLGGNIPSDAPNDLSDGFNLPTSVAGLTPKSVDLDQQNTRVSSKIPSVANAFGGVLSLGFNYKRLGAFVELLEAQGDVQVLSSPRIVTTNNQKALIKVGSDQFFVTNVTNTTTASGGTTTSSPTVDFESFFSGVALDVTPQIDKKGEITLHVHPTISSVSKDSVEVDFGTVNDVVTRQTYPLAKSSIRESDSIIKAKNGQVVVIGGLMQDKSGSIETGVPFLKDLPYVGKVFKQTRKTTKKTELVILLRPMLMDDRQWTETLEDVYNRVSEYDKG